MSKGPNAFQKVEELRKKEPELSVAQAVTRAGVTSAAYYASRRNNDTKAPGRPRALRQPKAAATVARPAAAMIAAPRNDSGLVRVILGTPAQIREILS